MMKILRKMKMMKSILKLLGFIKEEVEYPRLFAIVTYTTMALENGLTDDFNKVIKKYTYNNITRRFDVTDIRYSEEKIDILRNERLIPVYDETAQKQSFPIFGRLLPGEVESV